MHSIVVLGSNIIPDCPLNDKDTGLARPLGKKFYGHKDAYLTLLRNFLLKDYLYKLENELEAAGKRWRVKMSLLGHHHK